MKYLTICILFLSFTFAFSHDGKKHKKDSAKSSTDSTLSTSKQSVITTDSLPHHEEAHDTEPSKITADLQDFPTIHPLIVHFAIVLIIVAAALQLLNLWRMKIELSWIIAFILFVGVLTAWLASKNFHPHTHNITDHAQLVLDQHDKWADWTINTGVIGLLLHIINLFVFKTKRWAVAIVSIVLVVSAYSVSRAGHYGAQLVHLEGIGPKGKYLELEHEH